MPLWKINSDPQTVPDIIEADGFEIISNYVFWNEGGTSPVASVFLSAGSSVVKMESPPEEVKKTKASKKKKEADKRKSSKGKKK